MSQDVGIQAALDGAARIPGVEGSIAHLDLERGFALVARASIAGSQVIDPAVWVKEKLSVAMAGSGPEPPLRAALAAVRSLHGEIMKRPERDRAWIAVHLLLFHSDDGVAISAGDCPCYRYRDGVLAGLVRRNDELPNAAPRGSLGSETQVKIEVVPLRPRAGDLYLLTSRPLQEGELSQLARSLDEARRPGVTLRSALDGRDDVGRVAIYVLPAGAEAQGPDAAPADAAPDPQPAEDAEDATPLEMESIAPEAPARDVDGAESLDAIESAPPVDYPAPGIDTERGPQPGPPEEPEEASADPPPDAAAEAPTEPAVAPDVDEAEEPVTEAPREPSRRPLAAVGEERPWYDPLALWGGGALAFIALALLVRAIVPGILGTGSDRGAGSASPSPIVGRATGGLDIISEPPGAVVRLDGEIVPGRTPLSGVAVDPGVHRVELDWGAGGSWRDTIEVAAGSKLTLHPAIYGSISFRASEAGRVLDVYVDGAYAGTTPLTLDRVTVGRHLIRFGGPGLTMTAQEVDVLRDVHVELVGNAGAPPAPGKLTIKSAILGDEGFQAGRGDPVWIDGVARGATPFDIDLPPGMHSVRIVRRGFPAQISVIEVKQGGEHFATAEFGARSGEPLLFSPPASLSRSNPAPLTVRMPASAGDAEYALWIHAAAPGGSYLARPMTALGDAEGAYAALVPDEILKNAANKALVYFRATGPGGHELYTEIHTLPIRD